MEGTTIKDWLKNALNWGGNQRRFYDIFIEHGAVVDISALIGEKIGVDRRRETA